MGRKRDVSDAQILKTMALHPDPVVTAGELADKLDMTNSGMNKRLDQLVDGGFVEAKQVGARAVIYWLTADGRNRASE